MVVRFRRRSSSGGVARWVTYPILMGVGLLMLVLPCVFMSSSAGAASLNLPTVPSLGLLPSTTSVVATPSSGNANTNVSITATVTVAGLPGLLITPNGLVDFTYTNGGTTTNIGEGLIAGCLLKTCTTTVTTPGLPAGTSTITATFAGDLLAHSSTGTTQVSFVSPINYATTSCGMNTDCNGGSTDVTAPTVLAVDATKTAPSSTDNTVKLALVPGGVLNCPGDTDTTSGELAYFGDSAPDAPMVVDYSGNGSVGTQMETNWTTNGYYAGCLASPTEFTGYANGSVGDAPAVNGLYEAQVLACGATSGQAPCLDDLGAQNGHTDTYELKIPAGETYEFIG